MKEDLITLGLSEQEAVIYLALYAKKAQTAGMLARASKINRSVVYTILNSLLEKGLISSVNINSVKHFSIGHLDALTGFIKHKEEVLKDLLPKLKSLKEIKAEDVDVEVFQGVNGGIALFRDIVNESKDYLAFGDDKIFQETFGTLAEQYVRQLKEKRIKEKLLVPAGEKVLAGKYTTARYLPKEVKLPSYTIIYGDKVAIGIFQKPLYAILIKSMDLAESYRSIFEQLWKIAKKSQI